MEVIASSPSLPNSDPRTSLRVPGGIQTIIGLSGKQSLTYLYLHFVPFRERSQWLNVLTSLGIIKPTEHYYITFMDTVIHTRIIGYCVIHKVGNLYHTIHMHPLHITNESHASHTTGQGMYMCVMCSETRLIFHI